MTQAFKTRIAVFAGSRAEFQVWKEKQTTPEEISYIYVHPNREWTGFVFDDYKVVGSYWQSVDKARSFFHHIIARLRP